MSAPPEQIDEAPLPDAGLTGRELKARRVDKALQALAPRQREAIILVYYQDMSNQEAANVMRISVDALESLLARGRRSLQTFLMGEDDE
jgi:RNA polymerase sigma-70 factor (ECF subfamily)